jgi:hypothetical protein
MPARTVRALAAGAIITAIQVGLVYASQNLAVLLFLGPILGWSMANWSLGNWSHTKVRHAWPIGLADLVWILFAHGFEDGFGAQGPAMALRALGVLTFVVSSLCFFGRDGGIKLDHTRAQNVAEERRAAQQGDEADKA